MPLLNDFKLLGDDARATLPPGETLLALTSAAVAYGVTSGAEPEYWQPPELVQWVTKGVDSAFQAADRFEQRGKPQRWIVRAMQGVAGVESLIPSVDLPNDFPESLGGRTCFGPSGSLARQVVDALNVSKGKGDYLAVTSQRILVLTNDMKLALAMPRNVVMAAQRRPRMLARGRIGLVFGDGSWIVLGTSPHIGSWHAKLVVNALNEQ